MKRHSSHMAAITVIAVLCLVPVLAGVYVGGYFLLVDDSGRYPTKWLYRAYEPAVKLQHRATGTAVHTGYIDSQGRRYNLVLDR
jgi:hypothetical protein